MRRDGDSPSLSSFFFSLSLSLPRPPIARVSYLNNAVKAKSCSPSPPPFFFFFFLFHLCLHQGLEAKEHADTSREPDAGPLPPSFSLFLSPRSPSRLWSAPTNKRMIVDQSDLSSPFSFSFFLTPFPPRWTSEYRSRQFKKRRIRIFFPPFFFFFSLPPPSTPPTWRPAGTDIVLGGNVYPLSLFTFFFFFPWCCQGVKARFFFLCAGVRAQEQAHDNLLFSSPFFFFFFFPPLSVFPARP